MTENSCNWQLDSAKYTEQQIGEMPNWIKIRKDQPIPVYKLCNQIDTNSLNEEQMKAYNMIVEHSKTIKSTQPLLLIILGVGGTGKSYLIHAIHSFLKNRCAVTATTGKAAYLINGITIHSFLKLPVACMPQKDLLGQSLCMLQDKMSSIDYILIDEYSMLGQTTMGWIDRRCRQATGVKDQLFGGKSIILIGDPGQLPPVCDKPLYHSKPSNNLGQQGYYAYMMFEKVVILKRNERVNGSQTDQTIFRELLSRLRSGDSTCNDWNLLLTRQPNRVKNLDDFENGTRLYYSNEQVAKYNYEHLVNLQEPVAIIHGRHSSKKAKFISSQEMLGLEAVLYICKGARVMLTMNLWPQVGLCNGTTGVVVDIIYAGNHQPPDLPIAVIVKFDNYTGPSISAIPDCVPIPPITASVNACNSVHERQQIPLRLAWALTIHKSQGLTLEKAWIDIGKKETTLGLTYVALSRVRNLSSLIIEPMTFQRLLEIRKKEMLHYRLDEEKRLEFISVQS